MTKERLKTIIDQISIEGFENFGSDEDDFSCYLINRNDSHKWLKIELTFGKNIKETYASIRFNINFLAVTRILNKIMEIEYRPEYPYWWKNADTINIENEIFYTINEERIRPVLKNTMTSQDVDAFYKQIQFIYDQYLQTFIDKYPDLKTVNNEIIEKKSSDEWCNFIPGETIFKCLIIMKICENKQYYEFLNDYKSNIENAISNGNSRYIAYYNQLIKVIEYLKTDDYKQFL